MHLQGFRTRVYRKIAIHTKTVGVGAFDDPFLKARQSGESFRDSEPAFATKHHATPNIVGGGAFDDPQYTKFGREIVFYADLCYNGTNKKPSSGRKVARVA